jgi:hypothetical protein
VQYQYVHKKIKEIYIYLIKQKLFYLSSHAVHSVHEYTVILDFEVSLRTDHRRGEVSSFR